MTSKIDLLQRSRPTIQASYFVLHSHDGGRNLFLRGCLATGTNLILSHSPRGPTTKTVLKKYAHYTLIILCHSEYKKVINHCAASDIKVAPAN